MKPCKRFEKLQLAACRRLKKLKDVASQIAFSPPRQEDEMLLSFVVIETLNTWSNFVRAYYLSCFIKARTITGRRINTSIRVVDFNQAVGIAIRRVKPRSTPPASGIWSRRDEPAWHDHNILLMLCSHIGCSHNTDVIAAFSLGSRVFADLPVFRNFYAHRNRQTLDAASNIGPQYSISAALRPSQILLSPPSGRHQPLILDMIDDIIFTIEFLCN